MEPRKKHICKRRNRRQLNLIWTCIFVAAVAAVIVLTQSTVRAPGQIDTGEAGSGAEMTAADNKPDGSEAPAPKPILDFHMQDLQRGWIKYADGAKVTEDGGEHWSEASLDVLSVSLPDGAAAAGDTAGLASGWLAGGRQPATVEIESVPHEVKKAQFLTERIGWALLADDASELWMTVDGGAVWHYEVTPDIASKLRDERERLALMDQEAGLYDKPETAKQAILSEWTLLPDKAARGDVVLVRSTHPGEVAWNGKTYALQPFEAGYFTYLPIGMQVKPGAYKIGDQTLTIEAKTFDTQYLKVTKQMESMRQDTKRIQEDQKKIDAARGHSQPEFLFTSEFMKPIEGILTTPYGYTRYVNGKYDSSHMAIDLAADEGTPIKATNDGIVVLAEMLYLTGNSIYIDHGMGLFSQYAHMSELRVKTGDKVKKGDIIGLVGTTGFSTGPHLHFTFWVHNVQANPDLFFNTTPFHWLK